MWKTDIVFLGWMSTARPGTVAVCLTCILTIFCGWINDSTEFLRLLREKEKELGIQPDIDIDAFLKASAVEGHRSNPATEFIMRVLGLEVLKFFRYRNFKGRCNCFKWQKSARAVCDIYPFLALPSEAQIQCKLPLKWSPVICHRPPDHLTCLPFLTTMVSLSGDLGWIWLGWDLLTASFWWLQICQDTFVGNDMIRGISGGQKKRVTSGEGTTYFLCFALFNLCLTNAGDLLSITLQENCIQNESWLAVIK